MTAGRRSRAASGTRWLTPTAARSSCKATPPTSRIATGPGRCCGPRAQAGRSCSSPLPTRATRGQRSPRPAPSGSRSCASPPARSASQSTPGAGWSNGSSHGSTEIAGSPRISRPPSLPLTLSSTPHPLSCSYEGWHVEEPIRDRLLKGERRAEESVQGARQVVEPYSSPASSQSSAVLRQAVPRAGR